MRCRRGVYVETEAKDGTLRFEAAPAPSREELHETVRYVYARVVKWLARRGLLREADASNEAPSYSAGEAMTLAGMQRGTLETAKDTGERAEHELAEPPPRVTDAAVHERFNLHASVHVPAHDDLARERARVVPRPPESQAGCATSSSKKKSTSSVAEAGAELAAAVVSRIERPGLGPSAQNGTGEAASIGSSSMAAQSNACVTSTAACRTSRRSSFLCS